MGRDIEQMGLDFGDPGVRKLDVLETTSFARCPREYFDRWIERSTHTASGPQVVLGRALHTVLGRWMTLPESERGMASLLQLWREAAISDAGSFEANLAWWAGQELAHAKTELAEKTVHAEIDGFMVRGRVDVVLEHHGGLWLVDYKLEREGLPPEVVWDQVTLLAAALRHQYGTVLRGPITMAYVYFNEQQMDVLDCGSTEADALLTRVLERARNLDADSYPERPGPHCSECGSRWRCGFGRPDR